MSSAHPLLRVEAFALIAIGGFAGANVRYLVVLALPGMSGTLLVNVLGSFVLGFVLYEAIFAGVLSEQARFAVATGFLSSFTTYSTFALETAIAPEWALANVLASYALGITGVLAGREVATLIDGGDA